MTPFFWLRWARRIALLLVAAFIVVAGGTAFRVWSVARQDHRPRSDAILVLGASQYDGRPSEIFQARLDHAKALYDEHVAPRIVTVGGGRPGDRYTEAEAGGRYLAAHGVPRTSLVEVKQGSDTLESLRAAQAVLAGHGWTSAVLVTDPWHELRSRSMAGDLGIHAATSPVSTGPVVHGWGTELHYIARETAAYLFYEAFHRTSAPGPGAA